jgi:hypothetical protein
MTTKSAKIAKDPRAIGHAASASTAILAFLVVQID